MIDWSRLRLPVLAAPMFLVSGPEMVIASCRAGIIGSFPALNQRSTEGLDQWLTEIDEALVDVSHPGYAVNLIVHGSNQRLQNDLAVCIKHRVPLIITSLGAVPEIVQAVHGYGGLVYHDVINLRHAKKAMGADVDGLIAVSAGAGGHAGQLNPFALLNELRQVFDGTLILSGSLSTGRDVLAVQAAGADLAYLGTRFICTAESQAAEGHKRMIETSSAADISYTDKVSGVSANFLTASLPAESDLPAPSAELDLGSELTAPGENDPKPWKDIWSAGQGVGSIQSSPPVATLVDTLEREYQAALASVQARRFPAGS